MSGIEAVAVILFSIAMLGMFFNFFSGLRPKNQLLGRLWFYFTHNGVSLSLFVVGMLLLYIWG